MSHKPDWIQKKELFDAEFQRLYLEGYSATLMAEKMNIVFKKQTGFFYKEAGQWMLKNRKRLGLPPRRRGTEGLNTKPFTVKSKHQMNLLRYAKKRHDDISIIIRELEQKIWVYQERIENLKIEQETLGRKISCAKT